MGKPEEVRQGLKKLIAAEFQKEVETSGGMRSIV